MGLEAELLTRTPLCSNAYKTNRAGGLDLDCVSGCSVLFSSAWDIRRFLGNLALRILVDLLNNPYSANWTLSRRVLPAAQAFTIRIQIEKSPQESCSSWFRVIYHRRICADSVLILSWEDAHGSIAEPGPTANSI